VHEPSVRDPELNSPSAPASSSPWALILAAGQGERLAPLTRALYGRDVPKQFAALDGDRTLLQQTFARASHLSAEDRTVVVVADDQGGIARRQLSRHPDTTIVEQPRNVGTLPGLLLPLAHILARDPKARVVVYPADHHVGRTPPFVSAVRGALATIDHAPARSVLVGARADRPATDLGWILQGQTIDSDGAELAEPGPRAVESFVEKPASNVADELYSSGALWNTLIFAFDGAAFWRDALDAHEVLAAPFELYRRSVGTTRERTMRRRIYAELPTLDLSRDLLAGRRGLAVVEMLDAGWSDCGTPERLFECLAGDGHLDWLLRRLERRPPRAAAEGAFD